MAKHKKTLDLSVFDTPKVEPAPAPAPKPAFPRRRLVEFAIDHVAPRRYEFHYRGKTVTVDRGAVGFEISKVLADLANHVRNQVFGARPV